MLENKVGFQVSKSWTTLGTKGAARTLGKNVEFLATRSNQPLDARLNEVYLWHGTDPGGAEGITETDFDLGRAGKVGSMFGRGVYLAESCMKSDEYVRSAPQIQPKQFPLLLCRAVLGSVKHCDIYDPWSLWHGDQNDLEDACKQDPASGDPAKYHSIIGDREQARGPGGHQVGTFREFILYDPASVYPEWIVWYTRE